MAKELKTLDTGLTIDGVTLVKGDTVFVDISYFEALEMLNREISEAFIGNIYKTDQFYFKPEPASETTKECSHKWNKYHGLVEQYEFCEHCDKKRE